MGKFRKFMIALCLVGGISCLVGAAACTATEEPEYYQLTYSGKGVDFIFQDQLDGFENGGSVLEGVEVRFTVALGEGATGTPAIFLNDQKLTPDANGVYSFIMTGVSKLTATDVSMLSTLTFDKMLTEKDEDGNEYVSELRVKYYDLDGKELDDTVEVVDGQSFSFKVNVSVYYEQDYSVLFNTEELYASDGVYTIQSIDGDATISLANVELEQSFMQRGDGSGTADDPYLLKRPIDLYNMAALVNSTYYVGYNMAYYKLAADIDMKGEQLYVAGDASSSTAVFCGTFDGAGHTISNFYITDEVVDQETFDEEYLPYVGLFGYATASNYGPAVIKDVTFKDYTVEIHPGAAGAGAYVGSLVGYGIGVEISGCTMLDGEVVAEGDDNQMICIGGIAGVLQAAYSDATQPPLTFDSFVYASSTDIEVTGSGTPRSSGGIVGYLVSADTDAIAYVADCYALGIVTGGIHAGGIVGTLGTFSSVFNSYATGEVIANNYISTQGLADDYKGAYAGGIVGYSESDTVISGCYAANSDLEAKSVSSTGGKVWHATGEILAKTQEDGESSVLSSAAIIRNCLTDESNLSGSDFADELGWNSVEWSFGGTYPALNDVTAPVSRAITLTIKTTDGTTQVVATKDGYSAMSHWYDGALDEYLESNDGKRSWGYYFDAQLKDRVPAGFVPSASMTLYVEYADYGEVTGRYYIDAAGATTDDTVGTGRITDFVPGSAYIELVADGTLNFRYGGMTYTSTYYYDGETVSMPYAAILSTIFTDARTEGAFYNLSATVDDNGTMTISSIASLVSSTSGETTYYGDVNITIKAIKENTDIVYGSYYGLNTTYTFAQDGTGTKVSGSASETFTYKLNGDGTMTLTSGNVQTIAMVNSLGEITKIGTINVSLLDEFAGTWSKNANAMLTVRFDGLGGVTFFGTTGTYTVEDGRALMTVGGDSHEAYFDGGLLVIDGETYSHADSFAGKWFFMGNKEQIDLQLNGIGADGYGEAIISYMGGVVADVAAQYDVTVSGNVTYIRIYVGNVLYGELSLSSGDKGNAVSGTFFSLHYDSYYAEVGFYLYDNFEGTWTGVSADFESVTFNGRGAFDEQATSQTYAFSGTATIKAEGNVSRSATYSLIDACNGTLVSGGKTYTIVYDELTGIVTVKSDDNDNLLARRDGWYGVVLYDEAGTSYTFDGKGYIGGTVTLSDGSTSEYVFEDGMPVIGGVPLTADGERFALGSHSLSFNTGFAKAWTASGNRAVEITEVRSDFTATLTFLGEQYVLTYNPADGTLVKSGDSIADKTVVKLLGSSEMSISGLLDGDDAYINCILTASLDGWQGEYTSADGASWTFDGLGAALYGSGKAVLSKGGNTTEYQYSIAANGAPQISDGSTKVFVLTNTDDGYASADGKKYDFVAPDALCGSAAMVQSGEVIVEYFFDGGGTLYEKTSDGAVAAYTYAIVSADEVTLTAPDGKQYKGTLVKTANYYRLTLTELTEA